MGTVTEGKKLKPKRQSKKGKRAKIQHQRKERALKQVEELHRQILLTNDLNLKRSYVKYMRAIAEKVQLQLPFTLKNAFCRRCTEVFTVEPERTYTVRLRQKPEPMIVYTCLRCGYKRKKLYKKDSSTKNRSKTLNFDKFSSDK